jgi:hypothetical protein
VSILSEIYINISNALLYLERYSDVHFYAEKAIDISEKCIFIL